MPGENLSGSFADVPNSEAKQEAPEFEGPAGIDFSKQIFGGLTPHPLEIFKLILRQMIQIRDVMHEILCDKLIDKPLTQPVNFHRPSARPVKQGFFQFGRACLRQASSYRFPFFAVDFTSADGTTRWHLERDAIRRPLDDGDDLRYHIAAALEQNPIVDLQTEPADFIFIEKRGVPDGRAAKLHRFQLGYRCERAGAPDLHADIHEPRCGLPRGEFYSDRPSGGFRRTAEFDLQINRIHLYDNAIDFIIEIIAMRFPVLEKIDHFLERMAKLPMRIHFPAEACNPFEIFRLQMSSGV